MIRSFTMRYGRNTRFIQWPLACLSAGAILLSTIALVSWIRTVNLAPLLHNSHRSPAGYNTSSILWSLEHVHNYEKAAIIPKDLPHGARFVGGKDDARSGRFRFSASHRLLFPPETSGKQQQMVGRKLLGMADREKKAMLRGLEDALLEPPRAGKDRRRVTRYLPELLGDETLDQYERRVFIDVGGGDEVEGWFERHYPTGSRRFEIIRLEMEEGGGEEDEGDEEMMTRWLRGNVQEGDYVVMKAEAEVVEGLVRSGAISLVDELFLECKHLWEKGGRGKKGRRAYWECIALFGRLRDEGVAVHQWWG